MRCGGSRASRRAFRLDLGARGSWTSNPRNRARRACNGIAELVQGSQLTVELSGLPEDPQSALSFSALAFTGRSPHFVSYRGTTCLHSLSKSLLPIIPYIHSEAAQERRDDEN